MLTIKVTVSTYYVGCGGETEFQIDEEEWDNMTEQEQNAMCWEYTQELIEWDYEVVT